jgi:hypothetical protein
MDSSTESNDRFPIRVSPNGRYFVDRSGRPFFWLGDTSWQLFRDYSLEDAETILKDRARKGFSVIQVMVTGFGDGTPPNVEGQSPWRDNNPAKPNEAYFARVDAIVKMARECGLILVLYLSHNVQREFVRVDNARAYARWVAERYRDQPHLLWALVSEVPIPDHLEIVHELVGGIREGASDAQLISYHPDPVAPALSSGEIHTEGWLAFNMIQTWNYYEGIYGWVTRDYRRKPAKPVVMAEGAYEEGSEYGYPISPWLVRKQAYWSYLAGGSHSYGHNHSWRVLPDWKSKLDAPGAQQMRILKDFFNERRWWELVPDQRLITSQTVPGTTLNLAARSEAGDWILAYLSSPSSVSIDMSRIAGEGPLEATWIDPRNGLKAVIGQLAHSAAPSFTTPPGWEDALLWIARPT